MSDINTKYLVYLRKSRVDGETETIELLCQRIPTDFAEVNGITDIGNIHTKRIYSKILYNFLMFCKYILTQRKIAVFHDVTHGYYIKLQYPVNIKNPNPRLAKVIIDQLGGPDGELSASLRYLNQRYVMPYAEVKGLLTDIGTEELAHVEIISAILYQLTKGLTIDEIKASGFAEYFVDHTTGIYPQGASGVPFTAAYFQSKGDIITDLHEDMAAEQKARTTYDNILRLADDPDVRDPIKFLRQREIVHFQRFGEALRITQDNLNSKNFYACNPVFDKNCPRKK